jgi:hypothetical protein
VSDTSLSAQLEANVLHSAGGRELAECGGRKTELTEGARLSSNGPRLLAEAGVERCSAISTCSDLRQDVRRDKESAHLRACMR